jgi:hypothetical protein
MIPILALAFIGGGYLWGRLHEYARNERCAPVVSLDTARARRAATISTRRWS